MIPKIHIYFYDDTSDPMTKTFNYFTVRCIYIYKRVKS